MSLRQRAHRRGGRAEDPAGLPARVALDAFSGRHFAGRVRRIAPYVLEVEKRARTVEVEVDFTRPEESKTLLVGYSADAEIILEARERVPRVPTQALLAGNKVLLLKDGVLSERTVVTGLASWQHTEIVKGLSAGDQVVITLGCAMSAFPSRMASSFPTWDRPVPASPPCSICSACSIVRIAARIGWMAPM